MRSTWARVLVLSLMLVGTMVLSALMISTNASAASADGTWVSRVSGRGYSQTYLGLYGGTVTDYFDAELELTQVGTVVTGTLTTDRDGYDQTFNVEGTVDGSTFLMIVHYGWDGVSYLNPSFTMTIDGNTMTGTASFYNVGVLVTGSFDLEKSGLFGVGGMTPIVSGAVIALGIVSIVVAASAGKTAGPKGFQPQATHVPPPEAPYQPSPQWTTDPGAQPIAGEAAAPQGGAGLQYPAPAPVTRPAPPKVHYRTVSQDPPRCPVHGDAALIPHFSPTDMNDPGSWYCAKCKGYPWGRD